ncbi:major capsid protein [Ruminiclostridium josui]|uniref:major capsid protein n=1 Tax=Ruminiclostridium josui TaxID=1499 RepID=UPI000463A65F|nr:major capsid protein [Ruminiclostridium josui]
MALIDNNTPRSMSPSFEKNMPVTTFFRDTFFPTVNTYPTDKIDMDFRKGSYMVAPFVAQRVGGINMGRKGFETKTYSPPRIAPERVLSPEVLEPRSMGETVHSAMTPEERQDHFIEQDVRELDDSITRREEVMCAELIANGEIRVRGYIDDNLNNYVDDDINYQLPAENLIYLSGEDKWDQTTAKSKYETLEGATEIVLKSGYNPAYGILGQSAWAQLRKDDKFMKMLDNRMLDIGMFKPELRTQNGNGLKYIGNLPEMGLELWVYYAWFLDYDNTVKPIFPVDRISILPSSLGSMEYAAITQLEKDERYHTYEGTRIPKIIANIGNDTMKYRLASRPIPKPYDVSSWVTMKVL